MKMNDHDFTTELLPKGDPPAFRPEVTVRPRSVWEFLKIWRGSITERTWPKVLAYTAYLTLVTVVLFWGCGAEKEAKEAGGDPRCFLTEKALHLEEMFGLWMAFTAYLFTSFVNAALGRYRETLGLVRSFQGRVHELMMLLHTYADPKYNGGGRNAPLEEAKRLAAALPLLLYARPAVAGSAERAEDFLTRAASHLTPAQSESLLALTDAGGRPYAVMMWISRLVLDNSHDGTAPGTQAFRDPDASCSGAVVNCLERFRGAHGTLVDSLDDAILPLPFAQLTVANVYLIFLLLPYAMIHDLGYALIPAGAIYFWFLDGMISFVFFADLPFAGHAGIKGKRAPQPLVNFPTTVNETLGALPKRFPGALAKEPKRHVE